MKKHPLHAKLLLLTLVLLTLACTAASAESGFTFRNGVTWDSTVDEMMAAEGVHDYDANFYQNVIYGQFTRYYIIDAYDGANFITYIYADGLPVMMESYPPRDTRVIKVYDEKAAEFTALYGEPIGYIAEDFYALIDIIWPRKVELEKIERVTAWRLEDGTLAVLYTYQKENAMAYINETRLLTYAE